jgi:hypothetical protein
MRPYALALRAAFGSPVPTRALSVLVAHCPQIRAISLSLLDGRLPLPGQVFKDVGAKQRLLEFRR